MSQKNRCRRFLITIYISPLCICTSEFIAFFGKTKLNWLGYWSTLSKIIGKRPHFGTYTSLQTSEVGYGHKDGSLYCKIVHESMRLSIL